MGKTLEQWEKDIERIVAMTEARRHKLRLVVWHRTLVSDSVKQWPYEARKAWNDHTRQVSTEMNEKRYGTRVR